MQQRVYELDGKSLIAAQELEYHCAVAVRKYTPKQTGNLGEINASWQAMYKKMLADLAKGGPNVLKETGLSSPSMVVIEEKGCLPRCYKEYPAIFTSPEETPRYFMYVPVSYDNDQFEPSDARLLDEKEALSVSDLLFAGGWLGNAPLVGIERKGQPLPGDFKPTPETSLRDSFNAVGYSYLVSDKMQPVIDEYKAALKEHNDAVSKAFDLTKLLISQLFDEAGEDGSSINVSMSYGQHLKDLDKGLSGMEANVNDGAPQIPTNKFFKIVKLQGRDYVAFRDDTDEGRAYRQMFEGPMEKRPEIKDFVTASQESPLLIEQDSITMLRYQSELSPVPDGLKPVSRELINWMKTDKADRNMGITPPPMPQKLWQELSGNLKYSGKKPKFG